MGLASPALILVIPTQILSNGQYGRVTEFTDSHRGRPKVYYFPQIALLEMAIVRYQRRSKRPRAQFLRQSEQVLQEQS